MIYTRILKLAKKQGYSIRKIESICNFSNGTIRSWRLNNNPPVRKLKQVADLLGVSVDELIKN
ncbi:helix-turn-helix domain-containing protein [Enterococcus cecorum]|uniref:helix-turn-helix domain-containing protein n=1 Tax=Enterococcus cecorum TaxID=44008 RepID=UPI001FAC665B|nr:helix-turn-helix transcriptional regulator [Enterococcus cecorum]MCJ0522194.1 helix-turn-helix transcriptional regulator [Enterococcus cecorum]MCJ0559914.1 helix-turn-helix transcriptional regulator [Enterococcus cecorum]MCJ0565494.1 helix-turn-helix transcriptional regulator [Enterococcus cecorum]